jgi:hypothetical protein
VEIHFRTPPAKEEGTMKKTVLFVLLFATALAASAQLPIYEPKWNVSYDCTYYNYSGPAKNPGQSYWTIRVRSNPSLIWATENFRVDYTASGWDNHAVAWAKPVTVQQNYWPYVSYTVWEFTDGTVQCKDTRVYEGRSSIGFYNCNDGHTRHCQIP